LCCYVAEDNHFQLRIVRATLQGSGVALDVALHGQEAVDAVTKRMESGEKLYDLIFMDSMMPVMDGATVGLALFTTLFCSQNTT
jgi:CheY-like chemotaxis protein